MANKNEKKPEEYTNPNDIVVNDSETILVPKLIDVTTDYENVNLKFGECIVEIISGNDKGKTFKTTLQTVAKYYSNDEVYKVQKKN